LRIKIIELLIQKKKFKILAFLFGLLAKIKIEGLLEVLQSLKTMQVTLILKITVYCHFM